MMTLNHILLSLATMSLVFALSVDKSNLNKRDDRLNPDVEQLSGQELIDYVNSHQKLWKAGPNQLDAYPDHVRRGMLGVNQVELTEEDRKNESPTRFLELTIPDHFDSRDEWSECESIKSIRDQSACGSCWAFGAVEAMSDRICIFSKGKLQVTLSSDDPLSCCLQCGHGCKGGYPLYAWEYWVSDGIVTGGSYTNHSGCRPYPFPPQNSGSNQENGLYPTPMCLWKCQPNYPIRYQADKHYGETSYSVAGTVEAIQKEIMTNGPVEASFLVYEDFYDYEHGIYKHIAGKSEGGHAVKIIGWGVDKDVPYWTIANSWNAHWGEKGFFRMLRGQNECSIESGIVAGLPKID